MVEIFFLLMSLTNYMDACFIGQIFLLLGGVLNVLIFMALNTTALNSVKKK